VFGWSIKERADPSPDDQNAEIFKQMVKALPENEPRFVVFDFTETKPDGRQIKKRAFCCALPLRIRARLGVAQARTRGAVAPLETLLMQYIVGAVKRTAFAQPPLTFPARITHLPPLPTRLPSHPRQVVPRWREL
jgi:hypothetical protein